jgi:hypothetical protein
MVIDVLMEQDASIVRLKVVVVVVVVIVVVMMEAACSPKRL